MFFVPTEVTVLCFMSRLRLPGGGASIRNLFFRPSFSFFDFAFLHDQAGYPGNFIITFSCSLIRKPAAFPKAVQFLLELDKKNRKGRRKREKRGYRVRENRPKKSRKP